MNESEYDRTALGDGHGGLIPAVDEVHGTGSSWSCAGGVYLEVHIK